MATKTELQAELEQLRAQMAQQRESDDGESSPSAEGDKAGTNDAQPDAQPQDGWASLLKSQGLDATDTEALLEQLSEELGDLPRNKPLITSIAAFGVGFVLGRMSK